MNMSDDHQAVSGTNHDTVTNLAEYRNQKHVETELMRVGWSPAAVLAESVSFLQMHLAQHDELGPDGLRREYGLDVHQRLYPLEELHYQMGQVHGTVLVFRDLPPTESTSRAEFVELLDDAIDRSMDNADEEMVADLLSLRRCLVRLFELTVAEAAEFELRLVR